MAKAVAVSVPNRLRWVTAVMLALISMEMFLALSQCGDPEYLATPARVAITHR